MTAWRPILLLLPLFAPVACAPVAEPETAPVPQLVQQKCSVCHGLDVALPGPRSARDWAITVETMVGHGMVATDEELRAIQAYLEAHHTGETK